LQKTFDSVFAQTFKDFEYIVMDGGSKDGSKEIIEKNADKINYWVSEKDKGVYNAMNNGIAKADGEYLLFLNSGDHLIHENILQEVVVNLSAGIVYGNILLVESDAKSWTGHYPDKLSFQSLMEFALPHSASFIKRAVFEKVGLYDENMKICSDWKFFLDAVAKHNVSYKHLDKTISVFYLDGMSSMEQNKSIIEKEKSAALQKDYPIFVQLNDELAELKERHRNQVKELIAKVALRLRSTRFTKNIKWLQRL
jgi:glycosyltransferase involved in cell wall biosynthesis